ncbi:MAG TPA: DNA repair protein RadC [Thermoanaerobaculia bacterium]|jgi:DNA repair protein RadC
MTDRIADLPRDERPRERMLMHGADTLSEAELIALLIGTGRKGRSAIQLARELLHEGMLALSRCEPVQLSERLGMGNAKATRIAAAFEIARRLASDEPEAPPLYDTEILGRQLVAAHAHRLQEHLWAAFLDSRNRIRKHREIYVGTADHTVVSTKDIIRITVMENASGVVLYHNHPSGDPLPSDADLEFTTEVSAALKMVDVKLVDHLIIGANRYYSMAERAGWEGQPATRAGFAVRSEAACSA